MSTSTIYGQASWVMPVLSLLLHKLDSVGFLLPKHKLLSSVNIWNTTCGHTSPPNWQEQTRHHRSCSTCLLSITGFCCLHHVHCNHGQREIPRTHPSMAGIYVRMYVCVCTRCVVSLVCYTILGWWNGKGVRWIITVIHYKKFRKQTIQNVLTHPTPPVKSRVEFLLLMILNMLHHITSQVFKARPAHFATFFNQVMDAMISDEVDQVSNNHTVLPYQVMCYYKWHCKTLDNLNY